MELSKDEAICLVLGFSDKNIVSSRTKLNKLLARLNLFLIPIDIRFNLNKYGSFTSDLDSVQSNQYYLVEPYEYAGNECQKYILRKEGQELLEKKVYPKLSKIMRQDEFNQLKKEIYKLSLLKSDEISDNEHRILLVDVDERFKLQQKLNSLFVDLKDLYSKIGAIEENSIQNIRLKSLIEYSYFLIKYLKEKRFAHLEDKDYDFDAHMFDYYFIFNIDKIIPFLKSQLKEKKKDPILINRYYAYITNSVKEEYPFSLDNKELANLIVS